MNKVYYLSTCSTCKRILNELNLSSSFELHDIKSKPLVEDDLHLMRSLTDSFESLFSRRSRNYKALKVGENSLEEADYKALILEDYTFLKRPVIIIDDHIFIGNSKKNIEALKSHLNR